MAPHDKPYGSSFSIFYERITEHLLNLASHSEIVAIDFLPYYIYSIYFVKKHLSFTDFGHIVLSTLHVYKLMRSASQQFTKVCPIITLFYRWTSVLLRFRGDEPLTKACRRARLFKPASHCVSHFLGQTGRSFGEEMILFLLSLTVPS